jgi:hypothetical protein
MFILSFEYYNEIFLRKPHFYSAENLGSAEHRFRNNGINESDRFSALTEAFTLPCDNFVQKGKSQITFLPW